MKFRIKKIHRYRAADGKLYYPGDIIDLPDSMIGSDWLEPVEPEKAIVKMPESKIEPENTTPTASPPAPVKEQPRKKLRSSAASRA